MARPARAGVNPGKKLDGTGRLHVAFAPNATHHRIDAAIAEPKQPPNSGVVGSGIALGPPTQDAVRTSIGRRRTGQNTDGSTRSLAAGSTSDAPSAPPQHADESPTRRGAGEPRPNAQSAGQRPWAASRTRSRQPANQAKRRANDATTEPPRRATCYDAPSVGIPLPCGGSLIEEFEELARDWEQIKSDTRFCRLLPTRFGSQPVLKVRDDVNTTLRDGDRSIRGTLRA